MKTKKHKLLEIKLYMCKTCGGIYGYDCVSQCDCVPDKDEFYETTATFTVDNEFELVDDIGVVSTTSMKGETSEF